MSNKPSRFRQTKIYLGKHFRNFEKNSIGFIAFGAIISLIVVWVIRKNMFETYDSTKSGFFAIISICIWVGIFNSIQQICKERREIKYDHMLGMHISSYVIAHVIYQFILCLSESIVMIVIYKVFIDFPKDGIIFSNSIIEYFLTILIIIFTSDMLGIAISSIVKSPNIAMTVMPFVLVIQLIFSGVLFTLEGNVDKFSKITVSKWGMEAIGSIGDLNNEELPLKISAVYPNVVRLEVEEEYEHTKEHLLKVWKVLGMYSIAFIIISIISLEFIDNDKEDDDSKK